MQHKIKDYAGGSLSPAILQNLPVGKAIVKTQGFNYGIPVSVPFFEERHTDIDALITRSKANYGKARTAPDAGALTIPLAANGIAPHTDEVEVEIC